MERDKKLILRKAVKPYEKTIFNVSLIQICNTLIPYLLCVVLGMMLYQVSMIFSMVLGFVGAFFLVRSFIIFHDCCHGSFFKKKSWNKILGNITGFLTLFPFEKWKNEHNIHHATSSNIDKKGVGDIWMMTIEEYEQASTWTKIGYRLYRHPFVMFVLGPIYLLLITNRINRPSAKRKERINTYLHNVALIIGYGTLIYFVGLPTFLAVFVPVMFIGGLLGIWLFYIQHTFEESYFEGQDEWEYVKAAVEGSSYYKLPRLFQWLTGNIGFHHVHHLSPRIPNYLLEKAHNETEALQHATTITLKESLASLRYKLYDTDKKRFITFREFYRRKHII